MTLLSSSISSSNVAIRKPARRAWVRQAAVFAGISLVLLCVVNSVLLAMAEPYKDGAALVCEHKRLAVRGGEVTQEAGKLNVLFFGNSRILAGLVPAEFDALGGGRTFSWNLALPALPIGPQYFEFKEYLEHHPAPGLIVLQLTAHHPPFSDPLGLFPYYAQQGANFSELVGYQMHRQDSEILKEFLFPVRVWRYRDGAGKYLADLARLGHATTDLRRHNEEIIAAMLKNRGYYFIGGEADSGSQGAENGPAPEAVADRPRPDLEWESDPYARKFFDLARESHTRVLLVFAPVRLADYQPVTVPPAALGLLSAAYENVKMAPNFWQTPVYPSRLFADPVHLNEEGALRFTREVWAECQKIYPDLFPVEK